MGSNSTIEPRVAFATGRDGSRLTEDDRFAASYLSQHGLSVSAACWDDPGADWRSFDAIVVRSCWDYHLRPDEFRDWLERLAAGIRSAGDQTDAIERGPE